MAQQRLSMRKIREALRLRHEQRRSQREIAASLKVAHSTVGEYLRGAADAGVSWPLSGQWDDARLEAALFPPLPPSRVPQREE